MIEKYVIFAGLLLCASSIPAASPAEAQTVQQSGSVTQGHIASWATNGIIKDGGSVTANDSLSGGSTTSIGSGATQYCSPSGCSTNQAIAALVPFTVTAANLNAAVGTAPGVGQTVVATLMVGPYGTLAATTLTCTISGASAVSCSDVSDQVNIAAGQAWAVRIVTSASAASTTGQTFAFQAISTGPPSPTSPAVLQSGNVTSGHAVGWITNGVVGDAGTPINNTIAPGPFTSGDLVFVNSLLQLADSGTPLTSVALLASPAFTGTPTAPTATVGTNTTQIATTAFVLANAATACTTLGSFPVGTGSGTVCSTVGGSGFGAVLNGGLQLSPQTNTLGQAISSSQTGPASGSQTGPFSFNLFTVTDQGYQLTGTGLDSFGILQANLAAVRINFTATNNNVAGTIPYGLISAVKTSTNADAEIVGIMGSVYNNVANSSGNLYGMISHAQNDSSGTLFQLIGHSVELGSTTSSTVSKRIGLNISSEGGVQGTTLDTAFSLAASNSGGPFGQGAGFKKVFAFQGSIGVNPLDQAADIFWFDQAMQIGNFANFSNVFVSGNVWVSNHLIIPGAIASNFTLPAQQSGFIQYGNQVGAGIGLQISNFTGPSYFTGTRADTSSTAPSAVQLNEPIVGFTAQPYDGTSYSETGAVAIKAAENQSSGHHGSYVTFFTTLIGSGTEHESTRIGPSGITLLDAPLAVASNGVATLGSSSTNGLFIDGQGSSNDVTIANKNQSPVCQVPTGTTTLTCATLIGTTSVTTPILYGGSGAASSLTLESTSGAGTTDRMFFRTGSQVLAGYVNTAQQWYFGGTNLSLPSGPLMFVSANTGAITAGAILTGTQLIVASADNVATRIQLVSSSASGSAINYLNSEGTIASPTATQSGDQLIVNFGQGYGTSYQTAGGAGFIGNAAENFDGTHGGTLLDIYTTPTTTVTNVRSTRFQASGGVSIGATTDPGTGGLFVNGATITFNGLATDNTHTDRTVCQDTTSKSLFFGSGAAGICLGTSGAQFKNIVGSMPPMLEQIARLELREYYYKSGYGDNGEHLQRGPTAQDVALVFPDLVRYDGQGQAINYDWGALVFIQIRAIQELKANNDNLRAEMAELRKVVNR